MSKGSSVSSQSETARLIDVFWQPYYTQEIVMPASKIETVVNLCKRRGLVYPAGEIYGGTRSAWDLSLIHI